MQWYSQRCTTLCFSTCAGTHGHFISSVRFCWGICVTINIYTNCLTTSILYIGVSVVCLWMAAVSSWCDSTILSDFVTLGWWPKKCCNLILSDTSGQNSCMWPYCDIVSCPCMVPYIMLPVHVSIVVWVFGFSLYQFFGAWWHHRCFIKFKEPLQC